MLLLIVYIIVSYIFIYLNGQALDLGNEAVFNTDFNGFSVVRNDEDVVACVHSSEVRLNLNLCAPIVGITNPTVMVNRTIVLPLKAVGQSISV